jgi:uncharacterized membrane protein YvbJ
MSLIKCPACGNMVSDQATNCPMCGCPVRNSGYPQHNPYNSPYGPNVAPVEQRKSNTWLYVIIALLVAALLACAAYFLLNRQKADTAPDVFTPTTEEVEEAPTSTPVPAPREEETRPTATPVPIKHKVANGSYRMDGVITHKQKYFFDMDLKVNDSEVTGRYIVTNGENIYVTLTGSIDTNGNMKLIEYKNGKPTGYYFTGKFDGSVYSGTYRSSTRKLTMDFSASTF